MKSAIRLPIKFKNSSGLLDAYEYCSLNWLKLERREHLLPNRSHILVLRVVVLRNLRRIHGTHCRNPLQVREVKQPSARCGRLKSRELGYSGESLTKMPHDLTESGAFSCRLSQIRSGQLSPDLVVIDLAMPVMNGIEGSRALKKARARDSACDVYDLYRPLTYKRRPSRRRGCSGSQIRRCYHSDSQHSNIIS